MRTTTGETAAQEQYQSYLGESVTHTETGMSYGRVLLELGAPATKATLWGNELGVQQVHELMADAVVRRSL